MTTLFLNGEYQIEQADRKYHAVPSIKPFYDPKELKNKKLKQGKINNGKT